MPPLAIAGVGLAAAGAGSALSASASKKAANKAANVALQTAQENNALARDIYGQNKETLSPYVNAGLQPNALLAGAAGYGDQAGYQNAFKNFIGNSDYGFQFGQGANKINSGYAGAGTLQSGAAMKGLEDYRQNLQSGYRGEFNNLLGSQQNLGFSAAGAQAGIATNMGNMITANNNSAGTAAANAYLAKGAAGSPFGNALSMFGSGLFSYGSGGFK